MSAFRLIALKRIEEAMERGEFDNLPGKGQPLDLSEDPFEHPEMRMANRVLRNAGVAPPEVSLRRELAELKEQLRKSKSEIERAELSREIKVMVLRINTMLRHSRSHLTEL
ncbi:MAG TPA: DUF1992 domain-containing protein [Blastocatellia bacterium]|nr:DUF1992 domain-containing protein [Blastocatellia bacterium]